MFIPEDNFKSHLLTCRIQFHIFINVYAEYSNSEAMVSSHFKRALLILKVVAKQKAIYCIYVSIF